MRTNGDETTNFTCRECGEWHDRRWMPEHAARLRKEKLCFDCDIWHEKIGWMNDPNESKRCVRTDDFRHYRIGNEDTVQSPRGFGGRAFIVEFFDGRTVRTTNLWYGGVIPERFRDRLVPNAKLASEPLPPLDFDEV